MKVCPALALSGALALLPTIAQASGQAPLAVTLNGQDSGLRFDGVGATSAGASSRLLINYPEPQRSQILDFLFKPYYGASLQTLKVEIGSDGNSTDGSEPTHMRTADDENYERGYEWWLMKEAKRRNPAIALQALAWNFPAWVKQANSQATADYLVGFLEGAKRVHGVDIDYIGVWNETRMDPEFIKTLRATLLAHHLSTRIAADDLVNDWGIVDAMDKDSQLRDAVDVIITHYPHFLSTDLARARSREWGKALWSSEEGPWDDHWAADGQQGRAYAEALNRNYVQGRMTSTNFWCPITSYYDRLSVPYAGLMRALTPWSGHYEVMSPLWVVAHTTQFAQPGWRYLDRASALLPSGGSFVALHDGAQYSVILETLTATLPQTIRFGVQGGLSSGPVHVWRTTQADPFREVAVLEPHGGQYEYAFAAKAVYSLTTTTGQARGTAKPPAARAFPMPYADNFEAYQAGDTNPRYFQEQNGSFEIVPCPGGRAGQCLRQMSQQIPIGWSYLAPWVDTGAPAVIGDADWRDYRVQADVFIEQPGYAWLFGRLEHGDADGTFDAYQFRLYETGHWELRADIKDALLAAGEVASTKNTWRHLALEFKGDKLSASIDGKQVATVLDTRHGAGLTGIGTQWNAVSFDNFSVEPLTPGAPVISKVPVRPHVAPPKAPPSLNIPVPMNQAVRLSWAPVADATSYRLRIASSADGFDKEVDVGGRQAFMFTTLSNGRTYYFRIVAVNERGRSAVSAPQSAIPGLGR